MKIDAERLRGFLDCMHDEADERDKRSAQIRAIVKAAKEVGYDTKAIRKVFTRERMDEAERAKQDDLLETYEGALGSKGRALRAISEGVPVGEAAKANGVHRATLARSRNRNTDVANEPSNATPHDPETGEIETALDIPPPAGPEFEVGTGTHSEEQGDRQSPLRDGGAPVETSTVGPAVTTPFMTNNRELNYTIAEDDLAIPPHLKRERVA